MDIGAVLLGGSAGAYGAPWVELFTANDGTIGLPDD